MPGEHADTVVRLQLEDDTRHPLKAVGFESEPLPYVRASDLAEKLSRRYEDTFVDVGRRSVSGGITHGAFLLLERWSNGSLWRRS